MEKKAGSIGTDNVSVLPDMNGNNTDNLMSAVFQLPGEISKRIEAISKKSAYAAFIILLSGMKFILQNYANRDYDIITFLPSVQTGGGYKYNLISLKSEVCKDLTFKDILNSMKLEVAAANKNMDPGRYNDGVYEHTQLVNNEVLVKSAVLLENIHSRRLLSNIQADITFMFSVSKGEIKCRLDYYPFAVGIKTIDGLINHITDFFEIVIQNPEMNLHQVELLMRERKHFKETTSSEKDLSGMLQVPAQSDDNLILIRKESDQNGHLFFIHDGSGGIESYIELCSRFSRKINCWGIKAEKSQYYAPRSLSIEGIASEYLVKMRHNLPHGPYNIIAWSNGGTIAFEIARQIEQICEKVGLLVLIDSEPPSGEKLEFGIESEKELICKILEDQSIALEIEKFSEIEEIYSYLIECAEKDEKLSQAIIQGLPEGIKEMIPFSAGASVRELVYHTNLIRTIHMAKESYIPINKLNTQVHYIRPVWSDNMIRDKWNCYCNRAIEIHDIPGNHYSIFNEPGVGKLAEIIEDIFKSNSETS